MLDLKEVRTAEDLKEYTLLALEMGQKYKLKCVKIWNDIKEVSGGDVFISIETLSLILEDQLKTIKNVKGEVKTVYSLFKNEVLRLYDKDLNVVIDLEVIFDVLKQISVDGALYDERMDHSIITYTLYDWVKVEEISVLENEAFKEMASLQKLALYLEKIVLKLDKKLDNITKKFHVININSIKPRESHMEDEGYIEYNNIKSGVAFLESYVERINTHVTSQTNIQKILVEKNNISTKLSEIYTSLITLETYCESLQDQRKEMNKLFLSLYEIMELMNLFFQDCIKDFGQLDNLKKMLQEHDTGYKALFTQLEQLTEFYTNFSESYDQLLIEIVRRRNTLTEYEKKIKEYQNELNILFSTEQDKRNQFDNTWGEYLPPTLAPAIKEQLEPPIIYPVKLLTKLPKLDHTNT